VTIAGNILAENGAYGIIAGADTVVTFGENTFRNNKSGDSKIEQLKPAPPK